MMTRHLLGKTGLSVSVLGFGAAPIGYLEVDQKRASDVLNMLLDRGLNLIDTAAAYEGSEDLIGNAISHRRHEYVLVSKCGRPAGELKGEEWSEKLILDTVDRSLRRLKTDYLDVMLLHSCPLDVLKKGEAIGALIKARDAGKVRHPGYSGDNEAATYAATMPQIAVIETSINICDQTNIDHVLPSARQHDVGVITKRTIANAAWKTPEQQSGLYREYAKPYSDRFTQMELSIEDLGFHGDPAKVWPEIALRFTLSQPGVHTAIIGTTKRENAEANIKAAEAGPLSPEVVQAIRKAYRLAEEASGQRWEGLT